MSDNAKTLTFVGVGLAAVAVALLSRPSSAEFDVKSRVGETLTNKFNNPDDAKRLKIVTFDEDTAALREFEVAEQDDGLWTIPSKDGYPADAAQQMATAALSLKDRKILAVESENAGDHELYGVGDPLSPKLVPGQKGVGMRVTLSDSNDAPLVDLIIGKAPKNSENQRYVREANRDVVYVIDIDPAKLSTKFDDWIEKDLLKLDAFDLKKVEIKDYSAQLTLGMTPDGKPAMGIEMDPRAEMTLALDDKGDQWEAISLKEGQPSTQSYTEFKLADDEELNQEALNGLKTALDDLQIVDVARKPTGLSEDLKAGGEFMNNREAMMDLMRRGFTPARAAGGGAEEIISSDGELVATMNDGVEYVLRFGSLTDAAGAETKDKKDETGEAAEAPEAKPATSDVHRYMFVMARFNEDAVERPELQPLPELPADEPATTEAPKPAGEATATEEPEPAPDGESTSADESKPTDSESTSVDGSAAPANATADAATDADKQKELDRIIAERKSIEAQNQRKLDEYQATLAKGREEVKQLNLRFGDWYFVVDNNVFNKVRLGRDGVIQKKSAPQDAAGAANPAVLPGTTIPGLPKIPGAGQ